MAKNSLAYDFELSHIRPQYRPYNGLSRVRSKSHARFLWGLGLVIASVYQTISKSWRNHWDNIITLFDYPQDIRKVIYTTNAIESLNSVIRKSTKTRKVFPNDDSAMKVIYLAIKAASKKWTMPIRDWKPALNHFMIEFQEIIGDHV